MVLVPTVTPVTFPDPSTVALLVLLLLQVPPAVASVKAIVVPAHSDVAPEIPPKFGFTVTTNEAVQPEPSVYIIVAVPEAKPDTIPVVVPTEAINAGLLLQVPFDTASLNVIVYPTQTDDAPNTAVGAELTATVAVRAQPEDKV
jgi:hypothetical protein